MSEKIGEEMNSVTRVTLISRLGSILETLKHEESTLANIGKGEIRALQVEIQLGDIMPF